MAIGNTGYSQQTIEAAPVSSDVATVGIINFRPSYRFTAFLNGEPVFSSTGLSEFDSDKYPLKTGSNELVIEGIPLTDDPKLKLDMRAELDKKVPEVIAIVEEPFSNGTPLVKKFSFVVRDPLPSTNDLDAVETSGTDLLSELAPFTLHMISVIDSRDSNQLAAAFKLSTAEVRKHYPKWFFDKSRTTRSESVSGPGDLEVVAGKKFMLVRPSLNYLKNHPEGGLSKIIAEDAKVDIRLSCLLFCKKGGKWRLLADDGSSVDVTN